VEPPDRDPGVEDRPALAYGNTVVWKPAELVPLTAVRLVEAVGDAGLPDGVLNVVVGRGSVVGDALVTNPDVAAISFTGSNAVGRALQLKVTGYDQGLRATPWLAESWEHNGNGTIWTFKLRKGVRFHDGSALTARDVVYSFQRLLDPKTKSPSASLLPFLDPNGIKALNAHTVRFHLKQPIADLPSAPSGRRA
jgi:ABC-type transport system substrate-binding protein